MGNIRFKHILVLVGVLFIGGIIYLSGRGGSAVPAEAAELTGMSVIVYKSPTCGCCQNYASYLRRAGLNVTVKETLDMNAIKEQYKIPAGLSSCHTTVLGEYVIEGHIPVEAIAKLVKERPALSGIALPGMPVGSPGMPGPKTGSWDIFGLTASGESDVFMTL
ncbi:MAG: DUF411 domain-containing protein [Patescibacteria group bacterium]